VASVNHVTSSIAAGYVASCGAVLVVAGASKLYRGARGVDGGTAMRRVLRMPQHWWKPAELAVGAAEIAMGALGYGAERCRCAAAPGWPPSGRCSACC